MKFIASMLCFATIICFAPNVVYAQNPSYGTSRKPLACPDRTEPKKGAITAEQAKKYFTCHIENAAAFTGKPATDLKLVNNLNIQVAPKSREATAADVQRAGSLGTPLAIDVDKPVYDIKGSYTSFFCNNFQSEVKKGTNCIASTFAAAKGLCFQDTFGDWHCLLTGSSQSKQQVRPPQ